MIPERCAACAAKVSFERNEKPKDIVTFSYMLGFASGMYAERMGRGACFCPEHGAEIHTILTAMGAQIEVEFMSEDEPS